MALSEGKLAEYNRRILTSRMRILLNNGFYGLLLMHIIFSLDEECDGAATDGTRIYFNPKFLDSITDKELDFVMMHQILHVALMHCFRIGGSDKKLFDEACDIVVNSNILYSNNMDYKSITLNKYGISKHKTPDDKEGYNFTAEEVYNFLLKKSRSQKDSKGAGQGGAGAEKKRESSRGKSGWDSHDKWREGDSGSARDMWQKKVVDAIAAIEAQEKVAGISGRGTIPLLAKRMLENMKKTQTDWRTVLTDFVQEEVCDYSFSPPDRRFDDSPFYLPDFNESDFSVADVLFMVDTSGSMNRKMIASAYREIKGAIEQFGGKLKGWLGFFDAAVVPPKEFESISELEEICPKGGGGTDFGVIFKYVEKNMQESPPKTIIILTDGEAPFPEEKVAKGIPVLWLLNNDKVNPPWGKVARMKN